MTRRCGGAVMAGLLALWSSACGDGPSGKGRDAPVTSPVNAGGAATATSSSLAAERALGGTRDWLISGPQVAAASQLAVWASPYSVSQADTLDVYVHSARGTIAVNVYRLGWYGGLGGRLVWNRDSVPAARQRSCSQPFNAPIVCRWEKTLRIPTATSWTSGIYILKVTDRLGQSYVYPFVVRDNRVAEFVVVVPQFTWQAYNDFGGSSLYTETRHNPFVSFERPFASFGGASFLYASGYSAERSVLRFLERNDYDVTYVSDVDLARRGASFAAPAKGLLFIGHSEYWTTSEYDRVERLRDQGKHLFFFSGNNAYWNIRVSNGSVTGREAHLVTCYKTDVSGRRDPKRSRPENNTVRFRNRAINRPENGLYGIMYTRVILGTYPLIASDSASGPEARQFLAAAGLDAGDTIPGIISKPLGVPGEAALEGDQIVSNGRTPPNLQVLFRAPYPAHQVVVEGGALRPTQVPAGAFHTTFFLAPSGAGVFASGSNEWGRWLDDLFAPSDPRIQLVTKSVLDWMRTH